MRSACAFRGGAASAMGRWRCAIGWAVYVALAALVVAFIGAAAAQAPMPAATPDAASLYGAHCASCHGADRYGLMGPALLELMETEDIDKFYLSHLNYGGRGNGAPRRATPRTRPACDGSGRASPRCRRG